MLRRILLASMAAALACGGAVAIADPAGAAPKPVITAMGNATCQITGKVKIAPPLTNQNTVPSNITGKLKGTCTGSTEQGVTPTKVKIGLSYQSTSPGTCNGLATPSTDPFTASVTWKASGGKINPTTATLKGFVLTGVPNFGFDLPNPNAASPRSTATGSYAGQNNASAHAHIDVPDSTKCDPTTTNGKTKPAKGIKKITILPGSTFTIG
jgi:hypothetical protein